MYITPITNFNIHYNYPQKPQKVTFCAHPDFEKIGNVQSCYFRRGAVVLASKAYNDIENLFYKIFKDNTEQKKLLIIGIGNSQEPFSYMASIKGILNKRSLKDNVDLSVVDLQSKPTLKKLKEYALPQLHEYEQYPLFAQKSIVTDDYEKWFGTNEPETSFSPIYKLIYEVKPKTAAKCDRVNDEVFNFVKDSYNNPHNARWDSRIQDVIKEYPKEHFDVISANNILPYIMSDSELIETINHIKQTLKPQGYFITDPYEYPQWMKDLGVLDNLRKICNGIYQKID